MALDQATAVRLTRLDEIKTFNPDVDFEDVHSLIDSLKEVVEGTGELRTSLKVDTPQLINGRGRSFPPNPATQEKRSELSEEERSKQLFYSDIIQLLSDTVLWFRANGSNAAKAAIGNQFHHLESDRFGIVKEWGRVGSEVSEDDLIKHKHEIPKIINYISRISEIHSKEEVKEKEIKADDSDDAKPGVEGTAVAPIVVVKALEQVRDDESQDKKAAVNADDVPWTDQELEHKQKIQYEATWIYNRALHELFISHGIGYDYLEQHPEIQTALLSEVMDLMKNSSPKELELLFANPRKRLELLNKLYTTLARSPSFMVEVTKFYDEYTQTLPEEKRAEFISSFNETITKLKDRPAQLATSEDADFKSEVSEIIGTDSPVALGNLNLSLESLILNHGIDLDFINQDENGNSSITHQQANAYNAAWLLQNMSDNHLLLMLGINEKLSKAEISELRNLVIRYSRLRAIQMAVAGDSANVTKGIANITQDEARAIKANDDDYIRKVLLPQKNDAAESVKKYGAEKVYRATTNDVKKYKVRESRQWYMLDAWQRQYIYEYLKYPEGTIIDLDVIPDRIYLVNFQEILLQANIAAQALEQAKFENLILTQVEVEMAQQQIRDFIRFEQAAQEEEALRQYLVESYLAASSEQEIAAMMEQLELNRKADLYNQSVAALAASQGVSAGEADSYRGGWKGRFRGSRGGGQGRLSPRNKILNSLRSGGLDSAAKKQAIQKLASMGGVWGKAAALMIDPKSRRKVGVVIAGITSAALVGLVKMLQGGGALVGGLLLGGGTTAALLLLTAVNPLVALAAGVVMAGLGAHFGNTFFGGPGIGGLQGTLSNWFFGGSGGSAGSAGSAASAAVPSYSAAPAASAGAGTGAGASGAAAAAAAPPAASGATLATAATGFASTVTGLSVGILAPLGSIFLIAFSSLTVLFIIQGAFLVPMPDSLGQGGSNLVGNDLGTGDSVSCLIFGDAGVRVGGLTSKAWTRAEADKVIEGFSTEVGRNSCFTSLLCDDGDITVYRASGYTYGGWAVNANTIVLYDGAFGSSSGSTYSVGSVEYTVVHEAGHLIDARNPGLRTNWLTVWQGSCFTYPIESRCNIISEPFAEAVVLTAIYDRYPFNYVLYDFPGLHFNEYQWMINNVYSENSCFNRN